ncbi:uncharacterized protein EAE97_001676 [Botrytis byssoidea]|uniref:Uncharacterized protein n=1 Tax=Botrytis byssoidea TaxID=139641 RepID=A0A9P5IYN9_9HELO|nr:uncharacterized protein EAE97_001676 [Botrytis byssoidea]KAF7952179.1 hypothetical protein EAE97_001676 [Botrytis byssoidea]
MELVKVDRERHTASMMTMASALRFPRMTNNFHKLVNEVGYLAFATHVCDFNEFELLSKKSKRNKPNKRVYFVTQKEVDEAWRALCESTFAVWPTPEDWSEERKQKYLETQLSQPRLNNAERFWANRRRLVSKTKIRKKHAAENLAWSNKIRLSLSSKTIGRGALSKLQTVDEAGETNDKVISKISTTEQQGKLAVESTLDKLETAASLGANDPGVMMTEKQGRLAERLSVVQLDDVDSRNDVFGDDDGDICMD